MYIIPTVTFLSNCSPVLPSQRDVCPEEGRSANLSNSVTSLTYESGLFSSEEENLLGNGALIEIDQEIMLVTAANTSTRTLTVSRGYAGTDAASHTDGANLFINPTNKGLVKNNKIQTDFDHRIAMSFSVMGSKLGYDLQILDSESIETSFPGFIECFNKVGGNLEKNFD